MDRKTWEEVRETVQKVEQTKYTIDGASGVSASDHAERLRTDILAALHLIFKRDYDAWMNEREERKERKRAAADRV